MEKSCEEGEKGKAPARRSEILLRRFARTNGRNGVNVYYKSSLINSTVKSTARANIKIMLYTVTVVEFLSCLPFLT